MNKMTDANSETSNSARRAFIETLTRHTPFEGSQEVLPGLRLSRALHPTDRVAGAFKPSLCLVAQGAKEISVGETIYRYDADTYLIATLEMPITGKVIEATPDKPYLSIRLDLDPAMVGSVMAECALPSPSNPSEAKAVFVSSLDAPLLDSVVRLLRTLDSEAERRVLLPLVKREIAFRLLTGRQGERLQHLPMMGAHTNRIAGAVQKLRKEFDRPISIEALATEFGMSSSGFHHHFKSVMDMSPLQFQKLIRLQEARRLMLSESLDAASAGIQVGYEDPSHFSRDYKRQFGDAPLRDVSRLRELAVAD